MKKNLSNAEVLHALLGPEGASLPLDRRLAQLEALRADPETSQQVDAALLERVHMLCRGLQTAQHQVGQLQVIVDKLTALPWYPAIVVARLGNNGDSRVLVRQGNGERVVGLRHDLSSEPLVPGDEVYLSHEQNVIMARADPDRPRSGATCLFERKTPDGRLVVKSHDEAFLVNAPPALFASALQPGDLLRWYPEALVAIEKLHRTQDSAFFLEEIPDVSFADIGGLDRQAREILDTLELHWRHPEAARLFALPRKGAVLLVGPAGNGKTMLAKALARALGERTDGGRSRFMNIKPGALHSMWYSQSEAQYREVFRVAREVGEQDPSVPVVLFFDEVDAIGVVRGSSHLRVHDTVLTAFITELDGLTRRGNLLVIAATNRREALDPALLRPGRLGDLILEIPRPNLKAARQIFAKHLPAEIPYARNGQGDDLAATRTELIETAVSRIYAPNAAAELAAITFRDGKRRSVLRADLVSGAVIANIGRAARERACQRYHTTGELGLTRDDLLEAIDREFHTAAEALTPANCRSFLADLPYDTDVVNVERSRPCVAAAHRFINLE